MTLCEKLEELGYNCHNLYFRYYKHYYDLYVDVAISLDSVGEEIETYGIVPDAQGLYQQQDIDNMQVAFNRLKRDIKEIEKWQKQTIKLTK